MSMIREFREFAVKGNVVDMAVGVVIGAGFGKIVSSLVADLIMPPLGVMIGGINFTSLKVVLSEATDGKAPRLPNTPNVPAPVAPAPEVQLLTEIRDLLKERAKS